MKIPIQPVIPEFMFSKRLLKDDQLTAIGCAAVESALTEEVIHKMILHLSGINEEKAILFLGNTMFDGKLSLLESLAKSSIKKAKHLEELIEIIEAVRRANTGRISLVHGVWKVESFMATLDPLWRPDGNAKAFNLKKPDAPTVSAMKAAKIAKEVSDAFNLINAFWTSRIFIPFVRRTRSRAKSQLRRQNP